MSFAYPWVLLGLLPALLLWILATRPRRQRWTAQILLVRALAASSEQRSILPRLRRILLGLSLCISIAALAGPRLDGTNAEVLLIHDGRASLQTRHEGQTCLERGVLRVEELTGAKVLVQQARDPRSLAEAHLSAGRTVVVLTDRPDAELPKSVGMLQVANDVPNAAICALSLQADGTLRVVARARGDTGTRTLRVLRHMKDGGTTEMSSQAVAGALVELALPAISLASGEWIEARIEPADALEADDHAILRRVRGPVRVAATSQSDAALLRALKAQRDILFTTQDADLGLDPARGRKSLVILREGASMGVEGVIAGVWADSARGELTACALRDAPTATEVRFTLGGRPLLVESAEELVLLTEAAELAPDAALPLLMHDLLQHLGAAEQLHLEGVLDGDASLGPRSAEEVWRAPAEPSRATEPLSRWFLGLVALLLATWLALSLRGRGAE